MDWLIGRGWSVGSAIEGSELSRLEILFSFSVWVSLFWMVVSGMVILFVCLFGWLVGWLVVCLLTVFSVFSTRGSLRWGFTPGIGGGSIGILHIHLMTQTLSHPFDLGLAPAEFFKWPTISQRLMAYILRPIKRLADSDPELKMRTVGV
jgi:hypothetical protein